MSDKEVAMELTVTAVKAAETACKFATQDVAVTFVYNTYSKMLSLVKSVKD